MADPSLVGLDSEILIGVLAKEINQSLLGFVVFGEVKRIGGTLSESDLDGLVLSRSDQG